MHLYSNKTRTSILGLFALLLLVGCNTANDTQALYDQYYEKPEFTIETRGIKHLEALKSVYTDNDYETAMRLLEKVKVNPGLRLYLGVCYMEIDQPVKAIEIFSSLMEDEETQRQAGWYLALCHLKNGNTNLCKAELSKLGLLGKPYNDRTIELLEEFY